MSGFCPNCGKSLVEGANFCAECGANLAPAIGEEYRPDATLGEMLFKADGRINRLRYIKRLVSLQILSYLLVMAVGIMLMPDREHMQHMPPNLIYFVTVISLAAIVPEYSWTVRRLHDLDRGSTIAVLNFLCNIVLILGNYFEVGDYRPDQLAASVFLIGVFIYLALAKGTYGMNKYGSDPLGRTAKGKVNWEAWTLSAIVAVCALIFLLALRLGLALQSL